MAFRNYAPANGFLVSKNGTGDFTTIGAALTAATSAGFQGDIFISPGTYNENLTLQPNVNLVAWPSDRFTGSVIINGKLSYSSSGIVTLSGLYLENTNTDNILAVTGTNASVVFLFNCYLSITTATGISYTCSNAGSAIGLNFCGGNIATNAGNAIFTSSGAGSISLGNCNIGSLVTPGTNSASSGTVGISYSNLQSPLTLTGTAGASYNNAYISCTNVTALTVNASGTIDLNQSVLRSGTAIALVVTSGTVTAQECCINSSNVTAVSVAGTFKYSGIFGNQGADVGAISGAGTITNIKSAPIYPASLTFDNTNILSAFVDVTPFTPVLKFGGATTGITYTNQVGNYAQIGNLVYYEIFLFLSSKGSATGNATITGFPVGHGTGDHVYPITVFTQLISSNQTGIQGYFATNQINLLSSSFSTSVAGTALTNANFANTSQLGILGFYMIGTNG